MRRNLTSEKIPLFFGPSRELAKVFSSAAMLLIAGCSRAPSFNLLGSFFPAWILCGVIGILLAVALRLFFVRIQLEQQLKPLILVYPCLAAFFTFTLWLLFFS
jgi:YtcA family